MPTPPFLLSVAQMRQLSPHFPLSHGIPRVDDRRVLSGIIYVIRHDLYPEHEGLARVADATRVVVGSPPHFDRTRGATVRA